MNECRIQAVDNINIEGPYGLKEELRWFYEEVAKLEAVDSEPADTRRLRFKSGRLALLIALSQRSQVDPMRCRVTLRVPSLSDAAEALEERKIPYVRLSGVLYTDRRIQTVDPGGNRVDLKREWPSAPL